MSIEQAEQSGYDAWVIYWTSTGCTPRASQCPARYMAPDDPRRPHYIKGWTRARDEFLKEQQP